MRRRLLNIAAAMSMILFLVLGGLWVRSLRHFERVDLRYVRCPSSDDVHSEAIGFSWYSNTLRLEFNHRNFAPVHFRGKSEAWVATVRAWYPRGLHWDFLGKSTTQFMNGDQPGFSARYDRGKPSDYFGGGWSLAVRPWLPTLLAAWLPAVWLCRHLAARSWQFPLRQLLLGMPICGVVLWAIRWLYD